MGRLFREQKSHMIVASLPQSSLRLIAIIGSLAFTTLLVSLPASAVTLDRVAAIVNGEAISLLALQQAEAQFRSTGQSASREAILNGLIEKTLVKQRAKAASIQVPPEQVEAAVADIMRNNGLTSLAELEDALAQDGKTLTQLRGELRDRLTQIQLVQRQVQSQVQLTDEAIRAYYDAHPAQFSEAGQIHLIQMRGDGTSPPPVVEQITDRASFDAAQTALASTPDVSVDDVGWIARADFAPTLADLLFDTPVGSTTPVVNLPGSWAVFLVDEATPPVILPFEDAREMVEVKAGDAAAQAYLHTWLDGLKRSAYIEIKPLPTP